MQVREFEVVLGLLLVVAVLVTAAKKLDKPSPILLVLGGLVLGFLPHMPRVEMRQEVIFFIVLPPLLYSDAWQTSWRDFRANLRPILLLAIGLVILTTVVVAAVGHALIPGLSWPVAFVLGAVVAPTDTVAAGEITRQMLVPRRIGTILSSESLVNDATALVVYGLAIEAVTAGHFSAGAAGLAFVKVSVGGIAVGLAVAWLSIWTTRRVDEPTVENTLGLLTPFLAYLLAETCGVSGVLAVVAAGLYLGRQSARLLSARTRLTALGFWEMLTFLLNGLLFLVVGLQLRQIVEGLHGQALGSVAAEAVWVSLTVIGVRILWVSTATYLPRWASRRLRARDPSPSWRQVTVIAWTGMRGGLSLAAALGIPRTMGGGAAFPGRDLILFLTFGVILATLVVQGLSLPPLIRILRLGDDGAEMAEENEARLRAAEAAVTRLSELKGEQWAREEVITRLQQHYENQVARYCGRTQEQTDDTAEARADGRRRLLRDVVAAQREAVIRLRDEGRISDAVLSRITHDLDLEEQRLG